jgi:UDP-N-acetylglucosamine 2-epimerase (non-hydrolysing)
MRERIEASGERHKLGLEGREYGVVTLHRPSNVDTAAPLTALVAQLAEAPGLQVVEPLGYVDFMNVACGARLIITDSGGIQEETTYLDIPCLTVRTTTERPITITEGTNRLVAAGELVPAVDEILAGHWTHGRKPELWDGRAAVRVAVDIHRRLLGASPGEAGEISASQTFGERALGNA